MPFSQEHQIVQTNSDFNTDSHGTFMTSDFASDYLVKLVSLKDAAGSCELRARHWLVSSKVTYRARYTASAIFLSMHAY